MTTYAAPKLTRFACGAKGCGVHVYLEVGDPLPAGWRIVGKGRPPANWAGGALKLAEGKVGYLCPDCAGKVGE